MNEYGGYLPLEYRLNGEYWVNMDEKNILRLNSGRNAISYALQNSSWSKIYIPYYICYSVIEICERLGMKYELYHIDKYFNPAEVNIQKNEGILIVNYFGCSTYEHLCTLAHTYNYNIIIDNTQSFFTPPVLDVYNVYSCRKFIGVSDGAYLIKREINTLSAPFEQDTSSDTSLFLLKSLEYGTDQQYLDYLQNEERISCSSIKHMSKMTRSLLSMADYERIRTTRIQNYQFLEKNLKAINLLNIERADGSVPMIYPLLIKNEHLRHHLVQNRIYISQWWKWLIDTHVGNDFENLLSQYLLPIPIDQRYNTKDMENILMILTQFQNVTVL